MKALCLELHVFYFEHLTENAFITLICILRAVGGQCTVRQASSSASVMVFMMCPFVPQAGEAIQLECECRGDLALRHNSCAVKWARVKGDNVCDICKQPIKNLPAITPRAPSELGSEVDMTGFDDVDAQTHPHGLHGKAGPDSVSLRLSADRLFLLMSLATSAGTLGM